MNRAEHLQWCKDRAMDYINTGDVSYGIASFVSDMHKHKETTTHPALILMSMLIFNGNLNTAQKAEKFILEFN